MSMQHDESVSGSRAGEVATRAAEESKNVASTAAEGTREVVAEAAGEISSVVGQAKDQVQSLVADARTELQQQADTRAAQAADGLRRLSWQFGALAEGRPTDAPQLMEYMKTAEHRLSDAAARLEQRGPQGLLEDVASFARRRPGMFLLCAAGAGFAAGRLVRSGALSQSGNSSSAQVAPLPPPMVGVGAESSPAPVAAGSAMYRSETDGIQR